MVDGAQIDEGQIEIESADAENDSRARSTRAEAVSPVRSVSVVSQSRIAADRLNERTGRLRRTGMCSLTQSVYDTIWRRRQGAAGRLRDFDGVGDWRYSGLALRFGDLLRALYGWINRRQGGETVTGRVRAGAMAANAYEVSE